MWVQRVPVPPLRPFVSVLWAQGANESAARGPSRERVLPTGSMHLVFRLSREPLLVYDDVASVCPRSMGHAVVGGARAGCYVRDISSPAETVGVQLHPGAGRLLFPGSVLELAGTHTPLEGLWGGEAELIAERLSSTADLQCRLDFIEQVLLGRLPRVRGLHPGVAASLEPLARGVAVKEVVAQSGYSHRRFVSLFADAVGLSPKRYARVRRFGRALASLSHAPAEPLAQLALMTGYADQAHFNREFRDMAGLTPSQFRAAAPVNAHHVLV